MDLELNCEVSQFGDNVRFGYREISDGILVDVTRHDEDNVILLSDNDVERLYEYLGEYIGKDKESVPEVSTKSIEEVSELLEMSFRCTTDPCDTFDTSFDGCDGELYINVRNEDETSAIYLSSEDALTMAKNIIKAFENVGIEAELVVEEYEAASKADLKALEERYLNSLESIAEERSEIVSSINKDYAELKELKEDFRGSMEGVVKDLSNLNKDLNQVHVEISQIQNDIFNTNESTKVKLESLGKHIEGVSKEVVASMETLAGKVDYNFNEIHLIKSENIIRKINEDPSNVKV